MDHNIIKVGVWNMKFWPKYGVTLILKFCEHRAVQCPLSVVRWFRLEIFFLCKNLVDNLIYLHQV